MVFILLQPQEIILLDRISPAGINLSGGVFVFLQPLVSKKITEVSFF